MESSHFLELPHFFTANRIHFAEKCSSSPQLPTASPQGGVVGIFVFRP
jgi:hypothetical protein